MEEGSLRCDANVSVRLKGVTELGTKTEVKNLNSFKFVQKAIDYEIRRHIDLIEDGGKVRQETRLFDPDQGKTFLLRSKEEAHDYRYFPEPDLVPLDLNKKMVDQILAGLSESPDQKLERFQQEYNLPLYDAEVLTQEKSIANYFDSCALIFKNYKLISNWMMGELMGDWNDRGIRADESLVSPTQFCELLNLIETSKITGKIAKTVFVTMLETGQNAQKIVEEKGLEVVSDTGELEKIIDEIIVKSPKVVQDYREGKQKAMGFFVGQVMKITRGKADPAVVNKILREKLS